MYKHVMMKNYTNATSVIIQAGNLKTHLKIHSGENHTYAISVTIHALMQADLEDIFKHTLEKSRTKAANANMHPLRRAI